MSKQVIKDARDAFNAWKEAPTGSYVERAMEAAIVRDIVPALIHAAERKPQVIGFEQEAETTSLSTDTEVDA